MSHKNRNAQSCVTFFHHSTLLLHKVSIPELSKRLRVAGEMGLLFKCNWRFSNFPFPNACKIELQAFREASAFIRVEGEMQWQPAYLDNPATTINV